jgi:hypothetical protein
MLLPAEASFVTIREQQRQNDVNFLDAYNLPQLPDGRDEVYERLVEAERTFGPERTNESYSEGSAEQPDELYVMHGHDVLLTADHATNRHRLKTATDTEGPRTEQAADHGTGGLGIVLAEDSNSSFIAPRGLQKMDANHDFEHPLKEAMAPVLLQPDTVAAFSLHRIFLARVAALASMRGYNIILGVGPNPSPETIDTADKMLELAKKYDLRAGINSPVLRYEADGHTPKQKSDGEYDTITFAASTAGTSRYFAQKTADQAQKPLSAMQVEISQANLILPENHKRYPGKETQAVGSYLAYLFLQETIELFKLRETNYA